MVTTNLVGGLGNQLFQIATTLSYAYDNNIDAIFCLSSHYLPNQGNNATTYQSNIFNNLKIVEEKEIKNFKVYNEPTFNYTSIPLTLTNIILSGYFQSEKYFSNNRNQIVEILQWDMVIENKLEEYKKLVDTPTCAVHIRRGDYLKFQHTHPALPLTYYYKSFSMFERGTSFLIFSDDIEWCKNNLDYPNLHFIDIKEDYLNLYLMSKCDNNIIANSSFSWWGAWLNTTPNKRVIAPAQWFGKSITHNTKDLIPTTWTII
jgi:hypothetical protein